MKSSQDKSKSRESKSHKLESLGHDNEVEAEGLRPVSDSFQKATDLHSYLLATDSRIKTKKLRMTSPNGRAGFKSR